MLYHCIFVALSLFVLCALTFLSHSTGFGVKNRPLFMESIFLPYVYDFETKHVPQVRATIEGVAIEMPVDTGSTGTLIGASVLPNVPVHAGTPAHHFFTSSKILYVGRLVDLDITFHGKSTTCTASKVPVLIVDKSWTCPWYDPSTPADQFHCPSGPNGEEPIVRDTAEITYMGIGFGRNGPRDGMPYATPSVNPFLNINLINGRSVFFDTMHNGYVLSASGVQLGLSPSVMKGFEFVDLERGVTYDQDTRDWAMVKMSFSVDGVMSPVGAGLIDTGIAQMYIRGGEGFAIPNITIPNTRKHAMTKTTKRVKPGTNITIGFPSLNKAIMSYSFIVGGNSTLEPTYALPESQRKDAYVNTGRNLLFGYSIAFDATRGRFGFRAAGDSPGWPHASL